MDRKPDSRAGLGSALIPALTVVGLSVTVPLPIKEGTMQTQQHPGKLTADHRQKLYHYLYMIRRKCADPTFPGYRYAGGKGRTCSLTALDLVALWHRDGAGAMSRPGLYRIDKSGNYEPDNMQWREVRPQ